MKKFVIIAMVLFLTGCFSMPSRDILLHEGTVKTVDVCRGMEYRYVAISFEGGYSILLETIENDIQPGDTGKLYVKISKEQHFVYRWEKL